MIHLTRPALRSYVSGEFESAGHAKRAAVRIHLEMAIYAVPIAGDAIWLPSGYARPASGP